MVGVGDGEGEGVLPEVVGCDADVVVVLFWLTRGVACSVAELRPKCQENTLPGTGPEAKPQKTKIPKG